jgi:hypothetical protein
VEPAGVPGALLPRTAQSMLPQFAASKRLHSSHYMESEMANRNSIEVNQGVSTNDAIRLARELGVAVEEVRRTGEIRFIWHGIPPVTHKCPKRRKTASRKLVCFLRQVIASGSGEDLAA